MELSYQDKFKKTLFAFALAIALFGGFGTFLTPDSGELAVSSDVAISAMQLACGCGSGGGAGIGTGSV